MPPSNFLQNNIKDHWISKLDDEDDDKFEYLYSTPSKPGPGSTQGKISSQLSQSSKLKTLKVGFIENAPYKSQSKSSVSKIEELCPPHPPTSSSSSSSSSNQSPKLVRPSSRRAPNTGKCQYTTNCGYSFIKRGKFNGFYDDRKDRCTYSDLDPSKNDHSNCYCLHIPIVQSPLRNNCLDSPIICGDIDEEMNEDRNGSNDDANMDDENLNDGRFLSSQFKKNRYKLTRVKHKFEDSKNNDNSSIDVSDNGSEFSVTEKFAKRMRKYHSVNNLSKKSSVRHRLIDKAENEEVPNVIERSKSRSRHNYLKSFTFDIGLYKPLTTSV